MIYTRIKGPREPHAEIAQNSSQDGQLRHHKQPFATVVEVTTYSVCVIGEQLAQPDTSSLRETN